MAQGWSEQAAVTALAMCNGDVQEALSLLEKDEIELQTLFNATLQDMVSALIWNKSTSFSQSSSFIFFSRIKFDKLNFGLDEWVARQTLVAQWTVDQASPLD